MGPPSGQRRLAAVLCLCVYCVGSTVAPPASDLVNQRTPSGSTPLIEAVNADDPERIGYLIGQGADLGLPDEDGWTPLLFAVIGGSDDIAGQLITAGAR